MGAFMLRGTSYSQGKVDLLLTSKEKIKTKQIAPLKWEVIKEFLFYSFLLRQWIVIPIGFITDYASVPWPIVLFIKRRGRHGTAAVIHDLLYRYQPCSRLLADLVMYERMAIDGVSFTKANIILLGLRLGGQFAWDWHTRRNKQKKERKR